MTEEVGSGPSSPSTPWRGPRPFVGRADVLGALHREVETAVAEGVRAIFLLGPAGVGKSALVGVLQEEAVRRHRALKAEYVDCAQSGTKTWAELAELFTRGHRLRRSAFKLAAEWVEAVPIVGKILAAIGKTVRIARGGGAVESGLRPPAQERDTALRAVRLLVEHGPLEPRLLIMDSLERGDEEDLAGAFALLHRQEELRTAFVAVVRTSKGRAPSAVEDLILEGERLDRARTLKLDGLSEEELREAAARATGSEPSDEWLHYLAGETRGVPAQLWALFGDLVSSGHLKKAGRRWSWTESPPVSSGVARADLVGYDLDDTDRRLLQLGALEGEVFHSVVLSQIAEVPEIEVEDRLSRLCRVGLIEYRGAPTIGRDITSQYAFRNPSDTDAFTARLSADERTRLREFAAQTWRRLSLPDDPP